MVMGIVVEPEKKNKLRNIDKKKEKRKAQEEAVVSSHVANAKD
jgi:hypothetical protein